MPTTQVASFTARCRSSGVSQIAMMYQSLRSLVDRLSISLLSARAFMCNACSRASVGPGNADQCDLARGR